MEQLTSDLIEESTDSIFFVAWPSSTFLTLDAKSRLQNVSPAFFLTGATWTTINVLESPPD